MGISRAKKKTGKKRSSRKVSRGKSIVRRLSRFLKTLYKICSSKYSKIAAKIFLGFLILAVFLSVILIAYYAHDLPDIEKLAEDHKKPMITVRTQGGEILANYGDIYGRSLAYSQIPQNLINAVLAIEDRRFFEHSGIDYWGILRALYANRMAGRVVQGGSTITQQLSKIIFLSPERSFKRKAQEAMLAIQLEKIFSKEQILAMYLNRVFLGQANFGVDAAAKYYFGKQVEKLTLYEMAVIAGMLKAPSKYASRDGQKDAIRRGRQVLVNMQAEGFISMADLKSATPPVFVPRGSARGSLNNPYFADYILEQVSGLIQNADKDLNVYTTLVPATQHKLEHSINEVLNREGKALGISQIAAIVMTHDGYMQAMVGGRSYATSQFNRAVHAKRQSGSAFKLFVYLAALENGYKLDRIVDDKPIKIGNWEPQNYTKKFLGSMSLKDAFAYSINTVAVQLSEDIGRDKVIEMAQRLGIKNYMSSLPSIALGSSDTTLLELTSAYSAVANGGFLVKPISIIRVQDSNGSVSYANKKVPKIQILDANTISYMKELLMASVNYGTSKSAILDRRQAFGKTGTSQNFRDAWFIGFVDDLVVGIWIGNDKNQSMKNVTGGMIPAKIFRVFMNKVYE